MSFVINGADWNFYGLSSSEVEELIEGALAFVDTSRQRGEEVFVGDDFQTRPMHGEATLWDLFFEESPISLPRELSQELSGWLMRAPRYADSDEWPQGFEDALIAIGEAPPVVNEDVAWVHYSIRAGIPAASMVLSRSNLINTRTATGSTEIHFVGDEAGRTHFWRDMMILDGDGISSLSQYASRAYPDLHFVDGVLNGANNRLSGGYLASRQRLKHALAVLNDWGHWAFTYPPPALAPNEDVPPIQNANPSNQIIEQRLRGLNITAAPENPNVREDKESREARETVVAGRTLYCEWHVKLELHQNRIHFHRPVVESDNRVVIGMIHEHLPLP